jgi:hypothetical protein
LAVYIYIVAGRSDERDDHDDDDHDDDGDDAIHPVSELKLHIRTREKASRTVEKNSLRVIDRVDVDRV